MYVLMTTDLGGHGDILRLIFVRATGKLYWQTNFGISPVILSTYFIHVYSYCKQGDLQIFFRSAQ